MYMISTECQKVSLALKIFNDKTVTALKFFPTLSDTVSGTEKFIKVILKLYKIVSVKHPMKGRNLRDSD